MNQDESSSSSSSRSLTCGSEVLCRVDRLLPTKAEVSVIALIVAAPTMIPVKNAGYRGSIRLQDARSFDVDQASIQDHFLPGDIVKAVTLVAGDAKSTFFSTRGAECGVIRAKDDDGNDLFPVDDSHMKNSAGLVFKRKVAKPNWLVL